MCVCINAYAVKTKLVKMTENGLFEMQTSKGNAFQMTHFGLFLLTCIARL